MSTEGLGRRPRLRALDVTVTRVRPPAAHTADVTVLFADLRGYTGMAEQLPAARVVPLLNEFFEAVAAAVELHGGTVYHMAGDAIMAGFGMNAELGGGARESLAAGHAMLGAFEAVAAHWRRALSIDAGMGVGLHRGEVAFGPVGPPRHKRTTLVGDTVNVAARLCARARAGEVLFSCTVAEALGGDSAAATVSVGGKAFLQLPQFALRGRRLPIDIWCLPAPARLAV